MRGVIPPLPKYVFMAWWLVKHMDNFTLPHFKHIKSNYRPKSVKTGLSMASMDL
jgi:hypothetical protein